MALYANEYMRFANYFIGLANESGDFISNLKLNKLLYYAQAWHLAITGRQLFKDDFEAWVHGPVIPGLYREYKHFGYKPIEKEINKSSDEFLSSLDEDTRNILRDVTTEYFGISAFELEKLTHREIPWLEAREGIPDDTPCNNVISKDTMRQYYQSFLPSGGQ